MFEFLVSVDGRKITGLPLAHASLESFSTYLLGQVLSFALLKQGVEPLHATVVATRGAAAAFVGDCGYGKSSLGASFLQAGHTLLTDDLLALRPDSTAPGNNTCRSPRDSGAFLAYPGPPWIKLFPEIARAVLGESTSGIPMNPLTAKLIIPLAQDGHCGHPMPLRAIYVLSPPRGRKPKSVAIRQLSRRRAFLALLQNTFNTRVTEPERLKRQFTLASQVAQSVPIKRLSYPRDLSVLPLVRAAILSDLSGCAENNDSRGLGTHDRAH